MKLSEVGSESSSGFNREELLSAVSYFIDLVKHMYQSYDRFRIACLNSDFTIKTVDYFLQHSSEILHGSVNSAAIQKAQSNGTFLTEVYGNNVDKEVKVWLAYSLAS